MRFTNFLIESYTQARLLTEKHELVLQKVIDAVDDAHIEYSDSKITFDIGNVSDTPQLRGLSLVIRPSQRDEIKLGRTKDGSYAIVINTTSDMPGRKDIDTFLASKQIYDGFKTAYTTYVKNFHDKNNDYEPNETQQRLSANSRDSFEGSYAELTQAIKDHITQYTNSLKELDAELSKVANIGHKKAIEMAKEKLKTDFLGKDAKEFVSKAMQLPEAEFSKHLDKEWKSKLEARLANFYNSSYGR